MMETTLYTVEYATIFAVLEYKSNVRDLELSTVADPFVQLRFCKVMLKYGDTAVVLALVMLEQARLLIFENN